MQSYKFIDRTTPPQPWAERAFAHEGRVYANPTEEHLLLIGYKPMIEEAMPEYNPETHYIEPYYTEGETTITKSWDIKENTL